MEVNRPPRRRRLVAGLIAGVALLALVVVGVALGGGDRDDGLGRLRLVPRPPAATPGDDVSWWAPVHGEPLGVAVDGPDVAAAALDEVRLLDGAAGRTRWKAAVPGVRRYRPAVAGDRVAATSETELVLLDRADGSPVASVPFAGPGPSALLVLADGSRVAVAGSETGQMLAVDATDGTVLWSVAHPGAIAVAPRGDGTRVLASWDDGARSTLRAFDARTGALRWERPLGAVAGPAVVAGGTVVVAHGEGIHAAAAHGLDPTTGAERWLTPLPGWWDPALEPAVSPDAVYLLDGMGTVVALDPASGGVRWRRETGRPLVDGRLALTADAVVFASYDDELMVLDRADGALRAADPQRGVPVDVAGAGERLVVALRLASPSRVEARPAP
jgi:outer membrane protein assembly factor BamB